MRGDVDVESGRAQRGEIRNRGFGTWQYDEIGVARQHAACAHANKLDARLGLERIEIVEIGDMRQDRHRDPEAPLFLPRESGGGKDPAAPTPARPPPAA